MSENDNLFFTGSLVPGKMPWMAGQALGGVLYQKELILINGSEPERYELLIRMVSKLG